MPLFAPGSVSEASSSPTLDSLSRTASTCRVNATQSHAFCKHCVHDRTRPTVGVTHSRGSEAPCTHARFWAAVLEPCGPLSESVSQVHST